MNTVTTDFAVVIQGGGGGLVSGAMTIYVELFALSGGQFIVVLHLTIGIVLPDKEDKIEQNTKTDITKYLEKY